MTRKREKGKSGNSLRDALGLYGYMGRYKRIFLPSLIALFLTAGLSLAFPYFLAKLIGGTTNALQSTELDKSQIAIQVDGVVIQLLAILALQAFISYWRVRGFIKAGESALNDIRKKVFSHLMHLPMGYFLEHRSGEISSRLAADLGIMRETLITTVPQFARTTVILVGGLVAIFLCSVKLSLIMLLCIPVVVTLVAIFGRKIKGFSRDSQDALADSQVVVEESIQSIADVKTFTNEDFEQNRYESALERYLGVTLKGARARAAFISFIIFVLFGTIAVVTWFGAKMLVRGEISGDEFTMFILFSVFVGASLGAFPEIMSQLQKTSGATERIRELIAEREECVGESAKDITLSGGIVAEGIEFSYESRPDVKVLDGLAFSINAGERVALVGPSGGGKSTVFSLLLGFYQQQKGNLLYDGHSVAELGVESVRKTIAMVPQEVMLFGGTIGENIGYGDPAASSEQIREAAAKANALEFIEEFPEGFDTVVGPRGLKLSGGQRQRIAIARAILADPKILLLDEATSALDTESERLVQSALDELMKGRTSLIIAHRLSTVKDADRILVLNNAKVEESGTHEELMTKHGTYRLLAQTQFGQ